MYIAVKELCGKFFAQVRNAYRDGDNILFESPEYLTREMALADAKCWMAFHGEASKVNEENEANEVNEAPDTLWVPVARNQEVELERAVVMRIVWEYSNVMRLDRAREQYAAKRALRPLLNWVRENELGLSTRDMREIVWWWQREGSAQAAERGVKAVEEYMRRQGE